jgi:phosphoribosylglycinamide formyltransferase-1
MIRIAVFASGRGSNAIHLYQYFKGREDKQIVALYTDNPQAPVLAYFADKEVKVRVIDRNRNSAGGEPLLELLHLDRIDALALAGYLSLIPSLVVNAYPDKIINVHPSLLPKFGGKGMYGDKVHLAVLAHGERESGITLHFVNEKYDDGDIIAQRKFPVEPGETLGSIQSKIALAERELYPMVLDMVL